MIDFRKNKAQAFDALMHAANEVSAMSCGEIDLIVFDFIAHYGSGTLFFMTRKLAITDNSRLDVLCSQIKNPSALKFPEKFEIHPIWFDNIWETHDLVVEKDVSFPEWEVEYFREGRYEAILSSGKTYDLDNSIHDIEDWHSAFVCDTFCALFAESKSVLNERLEIGPNAILGVISGEARYSACQSAK